MDYVIYGKIIIDDVAFKDGRLIRSIVGGGGPQALFGARIWSESVGLLSRVGEDMPRAHLNVLSGMQADLSGVITVPGIPTPHKTTTIDEFENWFIGGLSVSREDWNRLLSVEIPLPGPYRQPKAIHLITEFPDEAIVREALAMREFGTVVSLEPLLFYNDPQIEEKMLALLPQIDVVGLEYESASRIAGEEDPVAIMKHWARLGARMVALRHGAEGSFGWDAEHDEIWHMPPVPTHVVDTAGAGNGYGGGLAVGWEKSRDARTATAYGAVSAMFLISRFGYPAVNQQLQSEAQRMLEQAIGRAEKL